MAVQYKINPLNKWCRGEYVRPGWQNNNIGAMRTYNKEDHWLAYVIRVLGSLNKNSIKSVSYNYARILWEQENGFLW
jgi:hypothetical protein